MPSQARVFIVAGSDSGGGAGLQADMKTVTALGGFAATAVTAVTVQNTLDVLAVHPVPVELVCTQIKAVLSDLGADIIKLGMLGSAHHVEVVSEALACQGQNLPRVVDPVMIAKGGAPLLESDAIEALKHHLIPQAALLTPNAPEAACLTGIEVTNPDQARRAGEALLHQGAQAVLMKGGHFESETITDLLLTPEDEHVFEGPRLNTRHTHGTGCTLASACAVGLAQGLSLPKAVARAHYYVQEAIRQAPGVRRGAWPP